MGRDIDIFEITDQHRRDFTERVYDCLEALKLALNMPGFGEGSITMGAELESAIVTDDGTPAPINMDILDGLNDPDFQHEINRFNLEHNLSPVLAKGTPFSTMQAEAEQGLKRANEEAQKHNCHVTLTGILPTLQFDHFGTKYMTDVGRYHMLNREICGMRGENFKVNIDGKDPLKAEWDCITLEGANTSFQVHLRVEPDKFADTFNAVQLVTPLAIALAANSPLFMGHRLWQETRIALFRQSIDNRQRGSVSWREPSRISFGYGWMRHSAYEQYAESTALYPGIIPLLSEENPLKMIKAGKLPKLEELNLHMGTTWPWNRAVYSNKDEGHVRIEMRSLPSGPSIPDMIANAAFFIGVAWAMREQVEDIITRMPFRFAEYNFYRSAQSGLDAQILWPEQHQVKPADRPITDIIESVLPMMEQGLDTLGVESAEIQKYQRIIKDRLEARMTGAQWQLQMLEKLKKDGLDKKEACRQMTLKYIEEQKSGNPVTEWKTSL